MVKGEKLDQVLFATKGLRAEEQIDLRNLILLIVRESVD